MSNTGLTKPAPNSGHTKIQKWCWKYLGFVDKIYNFAKNAVHRSVPSCMLWMFMVSALSAQGFRGIFVKLSVCNVHSFPRRRSRGALHMKQAGACWGRAAECWEQLHAAPIPWIPSKPSPRSSAGSALSLLPLSAPELGLTLLSLQQNCSCWFTQPFVGCLSPWLKFKSSDNAPSLSPLLIQCFLSFTHKLQQIFFFPQRVHLSQAVLWLSQFCSSILNARFSSLFVQFWFLYVVQLLSVLVY